VWVAVKHNAVSCKNCACTACVLRAMCMMPVCAAMQLIQAMQQNLRNRGCQVLPHVFQQYRNEATDALSSRFSCVKIGKDTCLY
jgi:hypothetical protein